jgi:hypothetical protein
MYEVPTSEEFRDFLERHELSGAAAGRLVGVDSRAVRRWTAPRGQPGARGIPWAAWTLLRLYTAEISLDKYRVEAMRTA